MNSTHSSFMPTLENMTFPLFPLWFLATGLYMTLDQQLLAQVLVEIYWSRKSTTLKLFKLKFSACLGTQPASHVPHNAGVCSIPQLRLRSSKWEFLKISTNSGTVRIPKFSGNPNSTDWHIDWLRVLLCSPTGFMQTAGFNPNNGQFNSFFPYD